jgi:hypothetical protein
MNFIRKYVKETLSHAHFAAKLLLKTPAVKESIGFYPTTAMPFSS